MMLRRSHPGREVQGGAATCRWVLGGGQQERREDQGGGSVIPETRCHCGVTSPSEGQGEQGAGSSGAGHAGKQAESRREKKEEAWSGPRRS